MNILISKSPSKMSVIRRHSLKDGLILRPSFPMTPIDPVFARKARNDTDGPQGYF